MLIIDENMFKLARMQETLLKVSTSNKEENLKNYKKTVAEIDAKAFESILEEIKHIDEHNQSLEEELQFLEGIKSTYDQLLQLQLNFKRNCEIYGNTELKLSDLSRLNIEYIENRVNAIKGYLINLKNIEVNKKRLQELNDQLIDEEKKKLSLDDKLLELDNLLRNSFGSVEGRCIVDGNLQYTSVGSEYEKIGLDFNHLLSDTDFLNTVLSDAEREKNEIAEKVKVAEVCYNNILTSDSRQILNEINFEFLKVKYKVVMLKIVDLLSKNSESYKSFVEKRKLILDLIKYRLSYMEGLGMKNSIDPFSRTKVKEQLDTVMSLNDNSEIINKKRKEISQLNSWTEEMLSQNNNYLITLNDTRKLIEDNVSLSDIDITSVVSFEELLVKQEVADNQVIGVKEIPVKLNMNIIGQKTASVIKRVNQMMNNDVVDKKVEHEEEVIPELVIIPTVVSDIKEEKNIDFVVPEVVDTPSEIEPLEAEFSGGETLENEVSEDTTELEFEDSEKEELIEEVDDSVNDVGFDLFETVTPFDEPSLFKDRTDEEDGEIIVEETKSDEPLNLVQKEEIKEDESAEEVAITFGDTAEEMPEAFWVTQDEDSQEEVEEEISFDEQISALLSAEGNDAGRTRKRVA